MHRPRMPASPASPRKSARSKAQAGRAAGRAGTIALLGRPNVGKSTLLNAILGERIAIVSHHPQTTRDRIAGILTRENTQFVFFDTPGVHRAKSKLGERMNELASAAAEDCDVVLFMTDADVREGKEPSIREEDRTILASIPQNKPAILLVNKIDKVQPRSLLFPLLEAYGALRDFAAIVPVSALKTDGIERILGEIEKHLPEGEPLYGEEELSDKPVRFFVSEFIREQVLRRTRQEVPHGVAVSVDSFEEGPKVVRIAVTVHVAKDSHKAIIIGDGGKMLREIGIAARRRAEQMIGQQVHLETFVRATPRWFDDPARLADLGYTEGEKGRTKRRSAARKTAQKANAKAKPKNALPARMGAPALKTSHVTTQSTQAKKKDAQEKGPTEPRGGAGKTRSNARGHAS